jgi:cytochrome c biogenesis protein CcdA
MYLASLLLFASGVVWLVAHYALPLPEEAASHPLEPWMMRIHGAAALFGLAVFGALWANHVVPAWRRGERRRTGLPLLFTWLLLILSAYGLYYLADENWRTAVSTLHFVVGLALPLALAVHVFGQQRRKEASRQQVPATAPRNASSKS